MKYKRKTHFYFVISSFIRNFEINLEITFVDFVDFRHDSAKQTSLMALAAPSVRQ